MVALPAVDSKHGRHSKVWLIALGAVALAVVLAVCSFGTYQMFQDEKKGSNVTAKPSGPQFVDRDISSRTVDPAPLTVQEVFPLDQVGGVTGIYTVLKKDLSPDCRTAATGDLGALLVQGGCTQVVRATLRSANGQYLVTAGIFNLKDEASANTANTSVKPLFDAQKGQFSGMLGSDNNDAIVRAPSHLLWFARGHFVAYCRIVLASGATIAADDAEAKAISKDIAETYLRDYVIAARAVQMVGSVAPTPATAK